ncbi:MAG: hypothetical protein CM1200mP10_02190 [Candidatus Neomarinimicrobiota bacterium]|nr:MAG: hypothetical protein CM1200mP10_02190 [Candidatus Neomarinimicrobiota bacterium]
MVFGDYDVDGTTAASILYLSLTDFGGVVNTIYRTGSMKVMVCQKKVSILLPSRILI